MSESNIDEQRYERVPIETGLMIYFYRLYLDTIHSNTDLNKYDQKP